ncbi:MAG TPA: hypothetical protein VMT45_03795 [Thermoanaerobaculaceae bacterium]|nr:hypothetical protein [Thermoanaerobaculaceae bacterium]
MRSRGVIVLLLLTVAFAEAHAAHLLTTTGRAVFAGPDQGKAVVLQAEAGTRVEITAGGKTSIFVADREGVWAITGVGGVAWQERRWQQGDAWVLALLVALDPKAQGVRTESGLPTSYQPPSGAKVQIPAVVYRRDSKGIAGYTVGDLQVKRTESGPLPQLSADAFAVPKKQRSGLARLADATAGLFASDKPAVSSTAGARGVTEEEKKLGSSYNFAAVEKVEKITVDAADVDRFIRAGKLGGGL